MTRTRFRTHLERPGFEALEPRLLLAADLEAQAAATLYEAIGGAAIDVDITLDNIGDAAAEHDTNPGVDPWTVSLWLSEDDVFDPLVDTQVGSFTRTTLAAGGDTSDTVTFNAPAQAGTYTLFGYADSLEEVTEDSEANNVAIVGTLSVGPDLTIEAADDVVQAAGGGPADVTVQVNNIGTSPAEDDTNPGVDAWTVSLWLSTDDVFDEAADTLLGSYTVTTLGDGASTSQAISFTAPAGAGAYTLFGYADSLGNVTEALEANNVSIVGTLAVGPDLTIEAAATEYWAAGGGLADVTVQVNNVGLDTAEDDTNPGVDAWTVSLWLSADDTFDEATDTFLGSYAVTTLADGASASQVISVTAPAGAGTYTLFGYADSLGNVTEASEANNVSIVGALGVGPDLTVQAAAGSYETLSGSTVLVAITVENLGLTEALADDEPGIEIWTVSLWASTDDTFDAGADTLLGSYMVTSLAAGATVTDNVAFTAPAAGAYKLFGFVDSDLEVTEAFETNNTAFLGDLLVGVDLAIEEAVDMYEALPGAAVTVPVTVENLGAASAVTDVNPGADAWTVSLWLSTDDTFDAGTDTLLGSYAVTTLAGGATVTDSIVFNAPAAGSYLLFGYADSDLAVTESSEANNVARLGILLVGVDLVIQEADGAYQAEPGTNVDVTVTVENAGYAQAVTDVNPGVDAWTVSLWLSADDTFDAGTDTLVGSYTTTTLGGGAVTSQIISFAAPAAGTYTLFGYADSLLEVTEDSDDNNVSVLGTLTVGPDLTIEAADDLVRAAGGGPAEVTVQVNNIGPCPAEDDTNPGVDAWTVSLWLSTDDTFDEGTDTLLGSYTVTTLADGASTSQAISFTAPAGTGTYTLFGYADSLGNVTEALETNNVSIVGTLAVGPDLTIEAAATGYWAVGGQTVDVTVQVNNAGLDAAEDDTNPGVDAWTVSLWLSADDVFDEAADTFLGSYTVTTLAGGASTSQVITFTAPAGTQGYTLFGYADSLGNVTESLETNNVSVVGTLGVGPDLTIAIDDATVTGAEAIPGETSWVTVVVTNGGTGAASGWTTLALYGSADDTIDAGDYLLGQCRALIDLGPGQSRTYRIRSRVPANMPPGTYQVLAVVDPAGAIAEADETNNTDAAAHTATIVWKFGSFNAAHRNAALTIEDPNGHLITFWMAGGWGEVANGTNGFSVTCYETTQRQTLWLRTPRGIITEVESIVVVDSEDLAWDGSIRWIYAAGARFVDDGAGTSLIDVPGTLRRLWLNDVSGGQIQVGAPVTGWEKLWIHLGSVVDLVLVSDTPIRRLFALDWADTDDVDDGVAAPWIRCFRTAGDVTGLDLVLSGNTHAGAFTLRRAYIRGDLTDCGWDIGGTSRWVTVLGGIVASGLSFDSDVRHVRADVIDGSALWMGSVSSSGTHATLGRMYVSGLDGDYFINDSVLEVWTVRWLHFRAASAGYGGITYHTADHVGNRPTGVDVLTV